MFFLKIFGCSFFWGGGGIENVKLVGGLLLGGLLLNGFFPLLHCFTTKVFHGESDL